jgi:hypothetical protein
MQRSAIRISSCLHGEFLFFCTSLIAERVAHRLLLSTTMKWKKGGTAIGYVLLQCFCMDIGTQGRDVLRIRGDLL